VSEYPPSVPDDVSDVSSPHIKSIRADSTGAPEVSVTVPVMVTRSSERAHVEKLSDSELKSTGKTAVIEATNSRFFTFTRMLEIEYGFTTPTPDKRNLVIARLVIESLP